MPDETEYMNAFDRYLKSEEIVKEMNEQLPLEVKHAEEMLEWMAQTRKTGAELIEARASYMLLGALAKGMTDRFEAAEAAMKQATSGAATLMLYTTITADEEDREKHEALLDEGIQYTNIAAEEILALNALFKKERARLESLLIL